jgi:hypothetical protein
MVQTHKLARAVAIGTLVPAVEPIDPGLSAAAIAQHHPSASTKMAESPVSVYLDHKFIPAHGLIFHDRPVTITLSGPRMRYDKGAGGVVSIQLTHTTTYYDMKEDPLLVTMLDDGWSDRLAIVVKVKSHN